MSGGRNSTPVHGVPVLPDYSDDVTPVETPRPGEYAQHPRRHDATRVSQPPPPPAQPRRTQGRDTGPREIVAQVSVDDLATALVRAQRGGGAASAPPGSPRLLGDTAGAWIRWAAAAVLAIVAAVVGTWVSTARRIDGIERDVQDVGRSVESLRLELRAPRVIPEGPL